MNIKEDESIASYLDKTDWRKTIHRKLEDCVNKRDTMYYGQSLDSLVDAVGATYPGFNAEKKIKEVYNHLFEKYDEVFDLWLAQNRTKSKWQKRKYQKYLYSCFCHDMFEFIKNLCASKRMLLWGTKQIPRGFSEHDND